MTKTAKTTNTVASSITEAVVARATAKPQQTKKWDVEGAALIADPVLTFFASSDIKFDFLKDGAIYMVQKVRKIAQFSAGIRVNLDPATQQILQAALKLSKAKVDFTPKLQLAALSRDIEAEGEKVTKLGSRGNYSAGTAAAQSQTTRQALLKTKMATMNGKNVVVDLKHPLVMKALGIVETPEEEKKVA